MYKVGDTVCCVPHGVCAIVGICEREFMGERADYYTLRPIREGRATVYIPVASDAAEAKIKPLLSKDELLALIEECAICEPVFTAFDVERKKEQAEILRTGDRRALILMLRGLYIHRKRVLEAGKKLHASDERALRDGEAYLFDELSYVLEMERSELPMLISGESRE